MHNTIRPLTTLIVAIGASVSLSGCALAVVPLLAGAAKTPAANVVATAPAVPDFLTQTEYNVNTALANLSDEGVVRHFAPARELTEINLVNSTGYQVGQYQFDLLCSGNGGLDGVFSIGDHIVDIELACSELSHFVANFEIPDNNREHMVGSNMAASHSALSITPRPGSTAAIGWRLAQLDGHWTQQN